MIFWRQKPLFWGSHNLFDQNVDHSKINHEAAVTAQCLDNDQAGVLDEPRLIKVLIESRPILLMSLAGFSWSLMNKIEATLRD